MVSGERVEIRPKVARNVALLTAGCLAFVVAGVWMAIGQPALEYRFAGVLAVVFFGYGLTRIPALARRKVALVLAPGALEHPAAQLRPLPGTDAARTRRAHRAPRPVHEACCDGDRRHRA
jgi:hypothetical protein